MCRFLFKRFALKTKPRNFLKGLRSKPFKKFLVVRLLGKCSKKELAQSA
jgi:hypothetical protein